MVEEIEIGCPQCNHMNSVSPPTQKYVEVVYQPCSDNEGEGDHNLKRNTRCEDCHKEFDFYWCTGHGYVTGTDNKNTSDHKLRSELRSVNDEPQ
jgi:hypothetical protein